jgi:hypothetical protein
MCLICTAQDGASLIVPPIDEINTAPVPQASAALLRSASLPVMGHQFATYEQAHAPLSQGDVLMPVYYTSSMLAAAPPVAAHAVEPLLAYPTPLYPAAMPQVLPHPSHVSVADHPSTFMDLYYAAPGLDSMTGASTLSSHEDVPPSAFYGSHSY